MTTAKQMDIRANIKKYFDMVFTESGHRFSQGKGNGGRMGEITFTEEGLAEYIYLQSQDKKKFKKSKIQSFPYILLWSPMSSGLVVNLSR